MLDSWQFSRTPLINCSLTRSVDMPNPFQTWSFFFSFGQNKIFKNLHTMTPSPGGGLHSVYFILVYSQIDICPPREMILTMRTFHENAGYGNLLNLCYCSNYKSDYLGSWNGPRHYGSKTWSLDHWSLACELIWYIPIAKLKFLRKVFFSNEIV